MSTTKNLWGELPLAEVVRTPIAILREQATQLTELTKGLLEGEVSTVKTQVTSRQNTPFLIRFNIIVPALENYSYSVIRCYHSVLLYPISFIDVVNEQNYDCNNEDDFLVAVEKTLSSPSVHKAIGALLAQSKSEEPSGF